MHSEYSVTDGIVRLDQAVSRAAADGMPALALTDLANLFGLVKFYGAARAAGGEPVEQPVAELLRNAAAVVGDAYDDRPLGALRGDAHRRRAVAYGVADEVLEHLGQPVAVTLDGQGRHLVDRDVRLRERRPHRHHHAVHEVGHGDWPAVELQGPRLQP